MGGWLMHGWIGGWTGLVYVYVNSNLHVQSAPAALSPKKTGLNMKLTIQIRPGRGLKSV
jgi:hypothetical protein